MSRARPSLLLLCINRSQLFRMSFKGRIHNDRNDATQLISPPQAYEERSIRVTSFYSLPPASPIYPRNKGWSSDAILSLGHSIKSPSEGGRSEIWG
ncbi:hypothetical protein SUGI_0439610 [Cryptomeria japonica]|nr:hypothetical protein SUGI_0439610 [Cryptomeria japonica]